MTSEIFEKLFSLLLDENIATNKHKNVYSHLRWGCLHANKICDNFNHVASEFVSILLQ